MPETDASGSGESLAKDEKDELAAAGRTLQEELSSAKIETAPTSSETAPAVEADALAGELQDAASRIVAVAKAEVAAISQEVPSSDVAITPAAEHALDQNAEAAAGAAATLVKSVEEVRETVASRAAAINEAAENENADSTTNDENVGLEAGQERVAAERQTVMYKGQPAQVIKDLGDSLRIKIVDEKIIKTKDADGKETQKTIRKPRTFTVAKSFIEDEEKRRIAKEDRKEKEIANKARDEEYRAAFSEDAKPIGTVKYYDKNRGNITAVKVFARDQKGNCLIEIWSKNDETGKAEAKRVWIDRRNAKGWKDIDQIRSGGREKPTVKGDDFEALMNAAAKGEIAMSPDSSQQSEDEADLSKPAALGATVEPSIDAIKDAVDQSRIKAGSGDFIPDQIDEGEAISDALSSIEAAKRKTNAARDGRFEAIGGSAERQIGREIPKDRRDDWRQPGYQPTRPEDLRRINNAEKIINSGRANERLLGDNNADHINSLPIVEGPGRELAASTEAAAIPESRASESAGMRLESGRNTADRKYREYTTRKNVFARFFSHKLEKLANWGERITGFNKDAGWQDVKYDLAARSIVRVKNYFAGIVFDRRNDSAMKAEEQISGLRERILELEAQNKENLDIRDNPIDYSFRERIRAAKEYSSGFKKLQSLHAEEARKLTKLTELETLKQSCLNGINERSLAVSRDIEARIVPMQDKLREANLVLIEAQKNRDEAADKRIKWQRKLDDLKIGLLEVPKAERARAKAAIAACDRELRIFDRKFNQAETGLAACEENIGYLESLINPWRDMASMYQEISAINTYKSPTQKPEYRSAGDAAMANWSAETRRTYPAERSLMETAKKVAIKDYLKELEGNFGLSIPELTDEERMAVLAADGENSQIELGELQQRVRPILAAKGLSESRINSVLDQTLMLINR